MRPRELNVNVDASIKKLELGLKRLVRTRQVGYYPSLFKGKGLEFEEYKEYSYGDDASLIDWKASLRTNTLLIKKFKEERDLKAFFVIDVSDKMLFGSGHKLKCEYVAELASSLAYSILREGDRVGYSFFSDGIRELEFPKRGLPIFHKFISKLKDPEIYGGGCNLKKVLQLLIVSLSKDQFPIIISDFLGPINWSKELRVLASKVEVVGIKVEDLRDYKLPEGVKEVTIADPNSDRTLLVDVELIREKYERYAKKHRETVKKVFRSAGVDLLTLTTDQRFVGPIITFFKSRRK